MLTRRDLVHVWSLIAGLIMLAFNAGWRAGSGAWPRPARKVDR